jgi:hypothetical protein
MLGSLKNDLAWNPATKLLQTNTRHDRSQDDKQKQQQANTGQETENLTPG